MASGWLSLPLRILQLLISVVALGLAICFVVLALREHAIFDFFLVTTIWTIPALIYLSFASARYDSSSGAGRATFIVVEVLTWIMWFISWATLAHIVHHYHLGLKNCGRYGCSVFAAAMVLGIIEWLLFTSTLVMAILGFWRGGGAEKPEAIIESQVGPGGV